MPEYLVILLGIIVVTFFFHKKFQIKLFENNKQMFAFYLIIYAIGTVWDSFAILRGHWNYPGPGLLGIKIGVIPIEDYVFAIAVSYFGLVLYRIILKKM